MKRDGFIGPAGLGVVLHARAEKEKKRKRLRDKLARETAATLAGSFLGTLLGTSYAQTALRKYEVRAADAACTCGHGAGEHVHHYQECTHAGCTCRRWTWPGGKR